MTPQEALLEAARVIERDGWTQGDFYENPSSVDYTSEVEDELTDREREEVWYQFWLARRTAGVCALGAISRATNDNNGQAIPNSDFNGKDSSLYAQAARLLADHLGVGYGVSVTVDARLAPSIPSWNDAEERTKEDVILAMKRAATGG